MRFSVTRVGHEYCKQHKRSVSPVLRRHYRVFPQQTSWSRSRPKDLGTHQVSDKNSDGSASRSRSIDAYYLRFPAVTSLESRSHPSRCRGFLDNSSHGVSVPFGEISSGDC
jgi:hypothetical protein